MSDLISRQDTIDVLNRGLSKIPYVNNTDEEMIRRDERIGCIQEIRELSSVQSKRDIPMKPMETTDRSWGIPKKQAVCPKCDYYLGHVSFLGDYKGKRITYCETCGQAIDWEGWDFDDY